MRAYWLVFGNPPAFLESVDAIDPGPEAIPQFAYFTERLLGAPQDCKIDLNR
jgi:hypothetical protein